VIVVDPDERDPYDRPPLSKQVLAGEWEIDRIALHAGEADLGIEWVRGHAATGLDLTDRVVRLGNGDTIGFDGLVIATGAQPRSLPGTGDMVGVHLLRTLDDCLAIRSALDAGAHHVVVVGAGFIGAEVASTCRSRGAAVTMVEALPVPMIRVLGEEMGAIVADVHREHGVDVRLGVGIDEIVVDDDRRVTAVRLADGESIEADLVVVGIGVAPVTGWLDDSGVALDDGVVVDGDLRAAPGVVAVGDVARWPSPRFGGSVRVEHWENAIQMGEHAGRTLAREHTGDDGATAPSSPIPWFWTDQYDFKVQLAGLASGDDRFEIVHGSVEERRFVGLYGRADRLVGVLGMNRPRHVMLMRQHLEAGVSWDDAVGAAHVL
jgi:NADPH-dependent 2,4-dienoyl-CoA reductase/sulfur reductase-like enzyme